MITSLSPLDGRYASKVSALVPYFSEFALIQHRVLIEVSWFLAFSAEKGIPELPAFTDKELNLLNAIVKNFDEKEAEAVKVLEKTTNHDVKAVEYYLKKKLEKTSLKKHLEFIHFACTSEDINNLAYALMMKGAMQDVMLPKMKALAHKAEALARMWKAVPMLSLTHGQPATPTTVGKELLVFAKGLERQIGHLEAQEYFGKINGSTGNWSAHSVAYPKLNWIKFSEAFVTNLGLTHNPVTTQIESHDFQAELYDAIARFNTVLLDLDRDAWGYISRGVFKQRVVKGEVGSSTMPHKVNPIDFENSEGNLGLANALLRHLSEKLPLSRFQRDLTDSTVQRNIGVAFGHSLLAYESTLKGLDKLELNKAALERELDENWALLAEPIQTVLRKHGIPGAYEKLKALTRGKEVNEKTVRKFIQSLPLPQEEKKKLLQLTPATYVGLAPKIK